MFHWTQFPKQFAIYKKYACKYMAYCCSQRQRVKLDHNIVEILKKLYETLRKVSPIHEMMSRRGKKRATWKRRFFWNIARPRKGERRPCYINVNIEAKICSRHDKHDGEYKMDKAFDRCEYRLSVLDYETIFASR